MGGHIHQGDPFATPAGDRSPARRLRGRLVGGVTIWTSGDVDRVTGLTMSSVLVADGEPAQVLGLMKDTADLYSAIEASGRFVMHILDRSRAVLADVFAGLRPSPGGPFVGLDVTQTGWGPAIEGLGDRAYCRCVETTQCGFHRLVRAELERVELTDLDAPLVYFRGRYRRLEPRTED